MAALRAYVRILSPNLLMMDVRQESGWEYCNFATAALLVMLFIRNFQGTTFFMATAQLHSALVSLSHPLARVRQTPQYRYQLGSKGVFQS